jgi:4-amino-4-deoxy-L-arabinose transferase-like glycosyltransferase
MSCRCSTKWLNWLVCSAIFLHLLLAMGTGLSPDEAHYALYAAHLDWSYYDHPPLVGWLQWPFVQWLNSEVGLRILPMVLWIISLSTLVQLVDTLFPRIGRIRIWNTRPDILVFVLSPMLFLLGLAWVPDSLLMALTCRVMLLTWRLAKKDAHDTILWLELGLYLGLAGLSKYTAVLLAAGVVLTLFHAHGAAWLNRPGPWLAAGLALVCISPVIYWNHLHDWASLRYQFDHANGSSHWRASRVLIYLLILVLVYGIGLTGWIWQSKSQSLQHLESAPSEARLCLYFGLPGLVLFLYLSGGGRTLPHWPASSILALLPLAAVGCVRAMNRYRRTTHVLLTIQMSGIVLVSALMMSAGWVFDKDIAEQHAAPNPFADLHGWKQAAENAKHLAQQEGANGLAVMNWSLASRIAWYGRPLEVKVVNKHNDQFDIWFGQIRPADKLIVLNWSLMRFEPPTQTEQFKHCKSLDSMPVMHLGRQIAHFDFLVCEGWQGKQEITTP